MDQNGSTAVLAAKMLTQEIIRGILTGDKAHKRGIYLGLETQSRYHKETDISDPTKRVCVLQNFQKDFVS